MTRQIIFSDKAPAAIGPYSQAVAAGNLIFLSGQIPLDPKTGEVVSGDITAQTRRTLENIKAILVEAGVTFEDVVKTTVYLDNMDNYPAMNAVYAEYFSLSKPARSTVEVARLPKGVAIEIDCVAQKRD